MSDATRNTYLLLRAFCDELARADVAGVCTAPGSRSTPITLSLLAEQRLRCYSHVDERSAGFFALGLARETGRPAVVACTSGTAAANFLPAVVEAREAGVPLVVLTADRPPELRRVGAGQTIDQIKLFGDNVALFEEIDAGGPATAARMRWIRQLACRALATTDEHGPVHLNVALREPLVAERPLAELGDEPGGGGRPGNRPWTTVRSPHRRAAIDMTPARGLIVAGAARGGIAPAARLAAARGWPLLADPLSGARSGPAAIAHYDLLLRAPAFAARSQPELVVRLGDLPTSKPLRRWLASLGCRQIHARTDSRWQDPDGSCEEVLLLDRDAVEEAAATASCADADTAWLALWRDADDAAAATIDAVAGNAISEPNVVRTLARALPSDAALVVASSMPVRDVEAFWPSSRPAGTTVVHANRGANGIDGTIATAYGVAAAGRPTYLLIGDVALAHDASSLLAGSRLDLDLTIVLVDNGGGGIFDSLPIATAMGRDAYEQHVATPPGLDVAALAQAYGARHVAVDARDELADRLGRPPAGTTILHVRTDRAATRTLHVEIERAVAAALSG